MPAPIDADEPVRPSDRRVRVRALHPDDTVTPWTEPVRVGTELAAG